MLPSSIVKSWNSFLSEAEPIVSAPIKLPVVSLPMMIVKSLVLSESLLTMILSIAIVPVPCPFASYKLTLEPGVNGVVFNFTVDLKLS